MAQVVVYVPRRHLIAEYEYSYDLPHVVEQDDPLHLETKSYDKDDDDMVLTVSRYVEMNPKMYEMLKAVVTSAKESLSTPIEKIVWLVVSKLDDYHIDLTFSDLNNINFDIVCTKDTFGFDSAFWTWMPTEWFD